MNLATPSCSYTQNIGCASFPKDNEKTPFAAVNKLYEQHEKPIYGCIFNNFLPVGSDPMFATSAESWVNIYKCPLDSNDIVLIRTFHDPTPKENLFALTWCYDKISNDKGENPYLIAVSGYSGCIRIIDVATGCTKNLLRGHGDAVNELRSNPNNPLMLASASKDTTIRIWNIRNSCALVVLGGFEGHRDQVLSVDWSPCSKFIVSCSMDHTIRLWNIGIDEITECFAELDKRLMSGKMNVMRLEEKKKVDDCELPDVKPDGQLDPLGLKYASKNLDPFEKLTVCHFPISIIDDLHTDYVDCIRFLGDYCLSKGSGAEKMIMLFRFGYFNESSKDWGTEVLKSDTCAIKVMEKHLPDGDVWFMKMDMDPQNKWLVCGSRAGTVYMYNMKKKDYSNAEPDYSVRVGERAVRQVAFGGDGRVLIAVADDGSVSRIDRITETRSPQYVDILNFTASACSNRIKKGGEKQRELGKVDEERLAEVTDSEDNRSGGDADMPVLQAIGKINSDISEMET